MNNKFRTVDLKALRNVTGGAASTNWSSDSWKGANADWNGASGSSWNWQPGRCNR